MYTSITPLYIIQHTPPCSLMYQSDIVMIFCKGLRLPPIRLLPGRPHRWGYRASGHNFEPINALIDTQLGQWTSVTELAAPRLTFDHPEVGAFFRRV